MKTSLSGIFFSIVVLSVQGNGQDRISAGTGWATRIAESFLVRHPDAVTYDSGSPDQKWNYEQGFMLIALHQMSLHSGEQKYFEFVRKNLDRYVDEGGRISTFERADFNLDNVCPGRALLAVFQRTNQQKYRAAADSLRAQLCDQPRTMEGGFWHKKIYPYQMWLDGLFMAEPFYALYAQMFNEPEAYDDIVHQFIWIAQHTHDQRTGLYYHAWDERRCQRWADSATGHSPSLWGRAMGWYAMALVDVLDYLPTVHPKRDELVKIFAGLAAALRTVRDEKTGLWFQVVDQGERRGNYLEASASCMFAYSYAKGVNKGYLDTSFLAAAEETFSGVLQHLVSITADGLVDLRQTCRGAGLGGTPYRDGSFEYYVNEPQRTNDMKGVAAFLLAAIELEKARARREAGSER